MQLKNLKWTGILLALPLLIVGCAGSGPESPAQAEPSVDTAEVVCGTLQEVNDFWFGDPDPEATPESTMDTLASLSGRLAAEVNTWSGGEDPSLRSAAEQVSRDFSVINIFSVSAPTTVEESDQFIATLNEFPVNLEAALSLCD